MRFHLVLQCESKRFHGGIALAIGVVCGIGSGGCSGSGLETEPELESGCMVSNSEQLKAALSGACPEKNILMKNGLYSGGGITMGAGVHLTGELRAGVVLQVPLEVEQGATGVTLESFTLAGVQGTALLLQEDAVVNAQDLSIVSPSLYGVFASAGTMLTLAGATIIGSGGPGIWVTCDLEDCGDAGASRPNVALMDTVVDGAHLAGLAFFGSDVSLEGVTVTGTLPGPQGTQYFGKGGGGLTVASHSHVSKGIDLLIKDSFTYGVLLDASTGTLGDESAMQVGGVTIEGNGRAGFWAQNPPTGNPSETWFQLANASIVNNNAVGLGIAGGDNPGDEKAAIICKTQITGVLEKLIPTLKDGAPSADKVGDGLFWKGQANVMELDVTVSGSERQAVLIDGIVPPPPPGALLIALGAGNANNTVLQQSVPMGQQLMNVQATTMQVLDSAQNLTVPPVVGP